MAQCEQITATEECEILRQELQEYTFATQCQTDMNQHAQEIAETEYREAEKYRREMNANYESAMQRFYDKEKTQEQAKEMCREAIASVMQASRGLGIEAEKTEKWESEAHCINIWWEHEQQQRAHEATAEISALDRKALN